jgi:hypothetical protein
MAFKMRGFTPFTKKQDDKSHDWVNYDSNLTNISQGGPEPSWLEKQKRRVKYHVNQLADKAGFNKPFKPAENVTTGTMDKVPATLNKSAVAKGLKQYNKLKKAK